MGDISSWRTRALPCVQVPVVNPSRIMTPMERTMDEAVWRAFVHGDFSSLFRFLDFDAATTGIDVNYRRHAADFTSALMAAGYV